MGIAMEYYAGRFLATAPLHMIQQIRMLPGARMDPRRGHWVIADIAYNRREMRRWKDGDVEWSPAALEALHVDGATAVAKLPFPPAYEFRTTPFKHQRDALEAAYGKTEFAFFMEMGTGKSKTTIDLACAYATANQIDQVLVICPLTIRRTWEREILTHQPERILGGDKRMMGPSIWFLSSNRTHFDRWEEDTAGLPLRWAIVGVESLSTGGAAAVAASYVTPRTLVVVDESTRIKSHKAKRTQAAIALGRAAGYRLILTGAPITKGIEDLFGQFLFLSVDILGTDNYFAFRNTYCVLGGYQGKAIIGYQNTDRLMSDIKPYVYQVTKADALDLPPKVYTTREVPMAPDQKKAYAEAVKEARITLVGKELTLTNVLTKLLRLHQIVQGFVGVSDTDEVTGSTISRPTQFSAPKIDELISVLDETSGSAIIWCVYHAEIDRVAAALRAKYPDEEIVELHGRVSETNRAVSIERFQSGAARFIVGNPATGGLGVTLTRAETVIYMSNGFSLEHRVQSEDRAHRVGTKHTVTYIDMITPGTVDTMVTRALASKRSMSDFVRDALDEDSFSFGEG